MYVRVKVFELLLDELFKKCLFPRQAMFRYLAIFPMFPLYTAPFPVGLRVNEGGRNVYWQRQRQLVNQLWQKFLWHSINVWVLIEIERNSTNTLTHKGLFALVLSKGIFFFLLRMPRLCQVVRFVLFYLVGVHESVIVVHGVRQLPIVSMNTISRPLLVRSI